MLSFVVAGLVGAFAGCAMRAFIDTSGVGFSLYLQIHNVGGLLPGYGRASLLEYGLAASVVAVGWRGTSSAFGGFRAGHPSTVMVQLAMMSCVTEHR